MKKNCNLEKIEKHLADNVCCFINPHDFPSTRVVKTPSVKIEETKDKISININRDFYDPINDVSLYALESSALSMTTVAKELEEYRKEMLQKQNDIRELVYVYKGCRVKFCFNQLGNITYSCSHLGENKPFSEGKINNRDILQTTHIVETEIDMQLRKEEINDKF